MASQLLDLERFFSNDPSCEMIVQCLYTLNDLEFELYCSLLYLEKAEVSELMEFVGRDDRVIVNRALLKLMEKDLCDRKSISESGRRGYRYEYTPTPLVELRENLLWKIEKWYESAIKNVKNMQKYFEQKHGITDQ